MKSPQLSHELVFEPGLPKKRLSSQLVWFVVWLIVTGIALWLKPSPLGHGTHTQLGLPACPSVVLFDRPCPGCGLTTSWTNMVHLRVGEAFKDNLFGPILYLGFSFTAWLGLYGYFKGLRIRSENKLFNRLVTGVLICFLAFGFIRFAFEPLNSPYYAGFWKGLASKMSGEQAGNAASVPKDGASRQTTSPR